MGVATWEAVPGVASETVLDTAPEMPAQVAGGVLKAWAVRVVDSAELAAAVEVAVVAAVVAVVLAAGLVAVAVAVVAGSEFRDKRIEGRLRPVRFCRSVGPRV